MTRDTNDENNWLVATMEYGEGGGLRILHTNQAENIARFKAEEAALHYPSQPVYVFQRVATCIIEPSPKWL